MNKENKFSKALNWVKQKGFKDIKAKAEDYDDPVSFSKVDSDDAMIPDISAKKRGRRFYIELVSKNNNKQKTITKWKLLASVAQMKGGKLYLMAGRGYKAFAERIVKNYNLTNTQVVSI